MKPRLASHLSRNCRKHTGGEGDLIYSVSNDLPAGLSFDVDTRTVSGTPTTAGEATITYTVIDGEGNSAAAQFTIEIAAEPPPMTSVASVSATQTSIRESGETTTISVTADFGGSRSGCRDDQASRLALPKKACRPSAM